MTFTASFAVAMSLLASLARVSALPQIVDPCFTPTTTSTVYVPTVFRCNRQVCIEPTSVCAPGEPTASPLYTETVTAPDNCAVTVSIGSPYKCPGCATCTLESSTTPTPVESPAPTTTIVNPGGPMMTAAARMIRPRQDLPILDHNPGGGVLNLVTLSDLLSVTSILTIVKRDDIILDGHGGGPIVPVTTVNAVKRDDPILEGHGGGPMDPVTTIDAVKQRKRDDPILDGHGGGPMLMATSTPTSTP